MHPVVNQLVQLQQLVLVRDEQKVSGNKAHLESLSASIGRMTGELPEDVREQFLKLYNKDHVVTSLIAEETCSVCGIGLPTSLAQAVRMSHTVLACPNCARVLYHIDSPARRLGKQRRRTGGRKPGIARFSAAELMVPALSATTVEEAVCELATKMEDEGFVKGADKLVEAALQREALVSTAVGHGLAVPHARGVEGGSLTLALGLSRKGIRFDPGARTITRTVFFMVIPTAASAFYLKLLAGLTETFMHAEARKTLLACKTPEELWKTLLKVTRATIK